MRAVLGAVLTLLLLQSCSPAILVEKPQQNTLLLKGDIPVGSKDTIKAQSWSRHAVLDKDSRLQLFWNVDEAEKTITFEIQAAMTGWVGLGFSPNGDMPGSDIVTCWVKDGVTYFHDRHATGQSLPLKDSHQDYTLISASDNGTHTICRFSRKIDTCDIEEDFLITVDTTRIIYAFGEEDPEGDDPTFHQSNRGSTSLYLLDPPMWGQPDPATTKNFDIISPNVTIYGNKDTTYICSVHRGPTVETPHQYIGYAPLIQPGNEFYLHHILMYGCYLANDEEVQEIDSWVGTQRECYGSQMPQIFNRCAQVTIAWAVGSEGQMYPENVGFPIQSDRPLYYMMETHYNNPTLDTFWDMSGIRWYYTDVLREMEMGFVELGLSVTPFQMVPPKQTSFTSVAICPAACTENGFPEDGINVFTGFLHSHLLGRKMKLRLIRNGVEEPWFLNDEHYDFDFQESRPFTQFKKIYRGDVLILECTMDSTEKSGITVGGWGTNDEMCLAFLSYYPKSPMSRCLTYYDYDVVQQMLHFPDLILGDTLEFYVDENTTFSQYVDNFFSPWETADITPLLDLASTKNPPMSYCVDEEYNLLTDLASVTYPEMVEYEPPPRDCPVQRVPVEMTKSLKIANPRMASTNMHFWRKVKP